MSDRLTDVAVGLLGNLHQGGNELNSTLVRNFWIVVRLQRTIFGGEDWS